jgi:hypothetical protein
MHFAHRMYLCVSYESHNEEQLIGLYNESTLFSLWGTDLNLYIQLVRLPAKNDRTMAQAVNLRRLTVEARIRFQTSLCDICGISGTRTGFSPSSLVFPCLYHYTNAAYSSSATCCFYQDKRAKPGNLPKIYAISEIGENWIENKFHQVK